MQTRAVALDGGMLPPCLKRRRGGAQTEEATIEYRLQSLGFLSTMYQPRATEVPHKLTLITSAAQVNTGLWSASIPSVYSGDTHLPNQTNAGSAL